MSRDSKNETGGRRTRGDKLEQLGGKEEIDVNRDILTFIRGGRVEYAIL